MKRTVKLMSVTFGATALLSLGVACSSRQTPAPSVGAGSSSEPATGTSGQSGATSEMGTPGQSSMGSMGGAQGSMNGQQGQQGQQGSDSQQGALGSGLGGTMGQGDTGTTPPHAGSTNDKALCEGLASSAKLRVEDVQNGIAIVAVPKQGSNLASVRDGARRLESSIHGAEGMHGGQATGESCGIAQLGRLPSVTTAVTEGANSVRIVMTTTNPSEVKDLRKMGRDEIGSLMKSAGGHQQQ